MQGPLEEKSHPPLEQETTPNYHGGSESRFPIDSTNSQAGLLLGLPLDEESLEVIQSENEEEADLLKEELYKRLNRRIDRIRKAHKREFVDRVSQALDRMHNKVSAEIASEKTRADVLEEIFPHQPMPYQLAKTLTALVESSAMFVDREIVHGTTRVGAKGSTRLAAWEVECDRLEAKLKVLDAKHDVERALLDRNSIKVISKVRQQQAIRFSKKMKEMSEEYHLKRREAARQAMERAEEEAKLKNEQEEIVRLQKLEAHRDRAISAISIMKVQRKERRLERIDALSRERTQPKEEPLYEKLDKEFSRRENMMYYERGRTNQEIDHFIKKKRLAFHKNRNKMRLDEILQVASGLDDSRKSRMTGLPAIHEFSSGGARQAGVYHSRVLSGSVDSSFLRFTVLPGLRAGR